MKKKIVVWGASGYSLVVADIIRLQGRYEITGFLDDLNPARKAQEFCGATILGGSEQIGAICESGVKHMIFAIGDNSARVDSAELIRKKGLSLAVAIHPSATTAKDVVIGAGSVVCAGAVINPGSTIGENAIINTSSSIDHESIVERGVHIGPGAHLGGRANIQELTWIGIGATIKDRITVGAGSIIGAGSLVLEDIPAGVLAYGIPARVIKEIDPHGE